MTSDFTVHMDEYLPLREVVFNTLRQAILKGELKPGERLMEIALAEKLGVSRTPIREAMRKLELEGPGGDDPKKRCPGCQHYGEGSERCSGGKNHSGKYGY